MASVRLPGGARRRGAEHQNLGAAGERRVIDTSGFTAVIVAHRRQEQGLPSDPPAPPARSDVRSGRPLDLIRDLDQPKLKDLAPPLAAVPGRHGFDLC